MAINLRMRRCPKPPDDAVPTMELWHGSRSALVHGQPVKLEGRLCIRKGAMFLDLGDSRYEVLMEDIIEAGICSEFSELAHEQRMTTEDAPSNMVPLVAAAASVEASTE